ncbi:cupin domain-containing protein [Salinilacihabitans rarus]|uniref:cupin domain-containing protein n=1 Tax=Salinilacihabitans rarus TaxID=2961596 RepID=UPI0020C92468|nr:cupin domain-containing protein [Salinilacihabitans rarus]
MGYDTVSYDEVEPRAPGMHFLRDALDCETHGITVVEADAGWEGMEHEHGDEDHEETYLLLAGAATLAFDGDEAALEPGDAVRVDPGQPRTLSFDADDSLMVIVGAP